MRNLMFMAKFFLFILFIFLSLSVIASPEPIVLEKPSINIHDKASIERGAKFFSGNCMVCHSLKYLKRDPIALATGIDYDKMPIQAQQWWAQKPPPDLSLIAQARGPNWLYTYLLSFYQDNSRPSVSNNLVVDNTTMPNPFFGLQGIQILVLDKKKLLADAYAKKPRWFEALELTKPGTMTIEEFENTMTDLVNFLVYTSEPTRTQRQYLGWWVLGFLIIFAIVLYFLVKEYWKQIK